MEEHDRSGLMAWWWNKPKPPPDIVRLPDGSACFLMEIGPRGPGFINWLKFRKAGSARRWLFTIRQYRSVRTLSYLYPELGPRLGRCRALYYAWNSWT